MGLQIAKYLGAKTIFGSTRDNSKFNILKQYHADICIDISNKLERYCFKCNGTTRG